MAYDKYEECVKLSAGASITAADILMEDKASIVLNWMGGQHHARRGCALGFCYFNDCVLAIRRLLEQVPRVLYVDLDVHHGDGVEEAFLNCDRVMTLSVHQMCSGFDNNMDPNTFFPGTGGFEQSTDPSYNAMSLNVPLLAGIDTYNYEIVCENVFNKVLQFFQPDAMVIQCGADSIIGDRLGGFNLTIEGHAKALQMLLGYNVPTICLGGGGYTWENVSRLWAYESALTVNKTFEMEQVIPKQTTYGKKYTVDYFLEPLKNRFEKKLAVKNTPEFLNKVLESVDTKLKRIHNRLRAADAQYLDFCTQRNLPILLKDRSIKPPNEPIYDEIW